MTSALDAPPQESLTRKVAGGMLWVAGSAVVGRLASFGSQLVLGWLLVPEDFALYAIAVSVTALLWAVKNGGLREVLTQRGKEYDALAPGAFRIALWCNLALAALLAGLSPLLARLYDAPALPPLIWIIALYLVAYTPAIILLAKLSIDMRFATLGKLNSLSMTLRHMAAIGFALLGFGAASFLLPLFVVAAFDGVAYLLALRSWPRGGLPVREVLRQTLPATRWVMFGTLAAALLEQGDFLTLGLLQDKHTLGLYFFGFQLSVALEALFITGLRSVMLPAFTQLSDQPERQGAAYLRSCGMLSFLSAPICLGMAIVAEPLIHLLWSGKWDASVPVFQLMLVSLFARLLAPLGLALAESRGNWRLRSLLMGADGLGLVASAALGAASGGLLAVALWISGYRILSGLAQCLLISRHAAVSTAQTLRAVLPPAVLSLACALAGMAAGRAVLPTSGLAPLAALSLAVFTALYALTSLTLLRQPLREVFELGRTLLRKPAPATVTGG
ncbi:MAG: oligosaccharide flippase family protein [Humidesulfovibrio sp.]|nr:hypothetical protein [Desulfovibrio sp.]MDO9081947.1 oligosaccharide flippase family protein [Humidesulfovibrio sp.]